MRATSAIHGSGLGPTTFHGNVLTSEIQVISETGYKANSESKMHFMIGVTNLVMPLGSIGSTPTWAAHIELYGSQMNQDLSGDREAFHRRLDFPNFG